MLCVVGPISVVRSVKIKRNMEIGIVGMAMSSFFPAICLSSPSSTLDAGRLRASGRLPGRQGTVLGDWGNCGNSSGMHRLYPVYRRES